MHANRRVVLVEDDRGVREAVERILRGADYQVEAFDSAEALQAHLDGNPLAGACDCLVCDVRLPGACGFDLHRRLSEQGAMPPWIYITAHDDPALRNQAERDGGRYLLKPFPGRDLLALVAGAVSGHRGDGN